MGIDLKALQELQQQLAAEDPKLYNVVRMEREATDVDDDWLTRPEWESPACDGFWLETKDGNCPFSISSITVWEDVERLIPEMADYFGNTVEEFKEDFKKPIDKMDDAEDFIYNLPDYAIESLRITPFREYIRDSYPEAIFLTKASAEQFINSLDSNKKDNLVITCHDIENLPQFKLLIDLAKNVDLKVLAKSLPKEQKR